MTGRVDFIVAGAQKSGTTAMRHFLSAHPEIGMPQSHIKETHFFSIGYKRAKSGDYSDYHGLFDAAALAKVTGDVTPLYLYLTGSLERAQAYNDRMKVVVILRNPIDRAYSHWNMERVKGKERRSFPAALAHALWHQARHGQHPTYSYLQRGFYANQLQRLFSIFPREQCKIIKHEAFTSDYQTTLKDVFSFLGVSEDVPPPPWESIHTQDYAPLPRRSRRALRWVYAADIVKVERMLGWDCADWKRV